MNALKFSALSFTLLAAGCASTGANYTPIIDGPVGPNYNVDLAQCQQLSQQQAIVDGGTATTAATTAGVAGVGSVIINDNSDDLGEAVAVGAIAGLASGAVQNNQRREAIIRNCMRSRGYNVVG